MLVWCHRRPVTEKESIHVKIEKKIRKQRDR